MHFHFKIKEHIYSLTHLFKIAKQVIFLNSDSQLLAVHQKYPEALKSAGAHPPALHPKLIELKSQEVETGLWVFSKNSPGYSNLKPELESTILKNNFLGAPGWPSQLSFRLRLRS